MCQDKMQISFPIHTRSNHINKITFLALIVLHLKHVNIHAPM